MSESAAVKAASAGPFSGFERMVAWRYLRSRRKETVISVIASIVVSTSVSDSPGVP